MALNFEKLKEKQKELEEKVRQEQMENMSKELISFVLDGDLTHSFREEKIRKVTEQSKRVLSYWVKKGLIHPAEREKEGAWFYFDRTESIWIDIITQIREFGLDLDKILLVREALFQKVVESFRMIDFCLMHSILKESYLMIIYADGKTGFMTTSLYAETISSENLPPHLVFNFFHLAKNIFPNNNFTLGLKDPKTADLSSSEMKILYYLRTGDFQEIRVRLKDGETYLVEATRKIDVSNKLIDVIREAKYQDIEIKVENERIVYIKSTEKIKA
ncbi:MerR family transcriptional regulator [Dysgonomonas sp. 520]|uniref:MerR family transcriptional regulator n=1 Tax=Dysgonomonas sp. 520 TaxID=2302931 RepID=UPI0013CFC16E|nr:MerR family transcriptional regulator [Dysgonomonas sp. 520]NDW11082.1 hypothetical protein [Dysgonomonas sp. 520]